MQTSKRHLQNPRKEAGNQSIQHQKLFHDVPVEVFWNCEKRNLPQQEKWRSGMQRKVCGKLCGNCEYKEYKGLFFHKNSIWQVKKWKISVNTMPFLHNIFNTC